MTDHATSAASTAARTRPPEFAAVLAEFETPQQLVDAARRVRDAGFRRWDSHSPFPIHGIDEAMGIRVTKLPWITFFFGVCGIAAALGMIWFMNAYDYPFLISGKPLFALPAAGPISFELMVLLAAFATFLGMIALNQLPLFSSPLFNSDRFSRVTNDRFFISVDARDPQCQPGKTADFLRGLGAQHVEECFIDHSTDALPSGLGKALVLAGLIALVPPSIVVWLRSTPSPLPRYHLITDMDFQPKFKPQRQSVSLFADGRIQRPQVAGTIARGDLDVDDRLFRGLDGSVSPQQLAFLQNTPGASVRLVSMQAAADGSPTDGAATPDAAPAAAPAAGAGAADGNTPPAEDPLAGLPWATAFPSAIPVTEKVMQRGRERYEIYCAACHGLAGDGDGLVTQRALELQQGYWVKPVSYHSENLRAQPVGRLFNTITNGVRKMPPMGDQIPVKDRWAIVMYLRALQRSREASPGDVPADQLNQLPVLSAE